MPSSCNWPSSRRRSSRCARATPWRGRAVAGALTADTVRTLRGLGSDTSGEDVDITTVADEADILYAKDDILNVIITAGSGGAPLGIMVVIHVEERMPLTHATGY